MYVPGEQGRGLAVPTGQWCPIQQTSPGKKIVKGSVCYRSTNSHARLFCWGYEPSDSQTKRDWDWVGKKSITLQRCKDQSKDTKRHISIFFICRRSSDHRKKYISLKSKSSFDCSAWKTALKATVAQQQLQYLPVVPSVGSLTEAFCLQKYPEEQFPVVWLRPSIAQYSPGSHPLHSAWEPSCSVGPYVPFLQGIVTVVPAGQ